MIYTTPKIAALATALNIVQEAGPSSNLDPDNFTIVGAYEVDEKPLIKTTVER